MKRFLETTNRRSVRSIRNLLIAITPRNSIKLKDFGETEEICDMHSSSSTIF